MSAQKCLYTNQIKRSVYTVFRHRQGIKGEQILGELEIYANDAYSTTLWWKLKTRRKLSALRNISKTHSCEFKDVLPDTSGVSFINKTTGTRVKSLRTASVIFRKQNKTGKDMHFLVTNSELNKAGLLLYKNCTATNALIHLQIKLHLELRSITIVKKKKQIVLFSYSKLLFSKSILVIFFKEQGYKHLQSVNTDIADSTPVNIDEWCTKKKIPAQAVIKLLNKNSLSVIRLNKFLSAYPEHITRGLAEEFKRQF